jgi:hypothetical protein
MARAATAAMITLPPIGDDMWQALQFPLVDSGDGIPDSEG